MKEEKTNPIFPVEMSITTLLESPEPPQVRKGTELKIEGCL